MSECWIDNDYVFQVDGFKSYVYPRLKSSTKNGGGSVILVRDVFAPYVTVNELSLDSIVWLKIDKACLECGEDIYCALTYIPPSSSNYYTLYDCDLFHELEIQIAKYLSIGRVAVLGDLNSRTKTYPDFIPNDYVHESVKTMFTYISDEEMHDRINPDTGRNDFGPRLLNLCKSTGLRIVNGRHEDGLANAFTYHGPRGLSVIDYLLSTPDMFKYFTKFVVSDFNEYSDHAPLHLELIVRYTRDIPDDSFANSGNRRNVYKWNPDLSMQCREAVRLNFDSLDFALGDCVSQDGLDACVDKFSSSLHDIMSPFVKCTSTFRARGASTPRVNGNIPVIQPRLEDKPWFDDELKASYFKYISALKVFNKDKTPDNHDSLVKIKKIYKSNHNKKKQAYMRLEGDMLSKLKTNNPKQFFSKFSKKKSKCNVPLQELFSHFKDLASENQDVENNDGPPIHVCNDVVFEELDKQIDENEICKAILGLKSGKSHAEDCVLNEYLIECKDLLLPKLCKLFNCILDTNLFPSSWSTATIVPIFKKGDATNPNNYRGISIVSNLGKLFTSILNRRLLEWSNNNDVITDAQFGFRPGYSTTDAIFALHSIISSSLSGKKRLYCAFIDFQKAFDSVDRIKLWHKLSAVGIRGKVLNVIKSLYSNIRACVTVKGFRSEYFTSNLGLMQGEVLSPILFSMFINDFELSFINSGCVPYECKSLNLFLLMYADDLVLFSESTEGLQSQLDALFEYSSKWGLKVNIDKSQIVIFRNGGKIKANEKWLYDGVQLKVVDHFTYLGIVFNYNNKFTMAEKKISDQGKKAMFALNTNIRNMHLNKETVLSLFDSYVSSIFNYGSEVWGANKGTNIEKVHMDFCKRLLGVKRTTCNVMMYLELGRYPLRVYRTFNIIKYWAKLLTTNNCILKACYDALYDMCEVHNKKNWATDVKQQLTDLGLLELWSNQYIDSRYFPVIKQRILDQELQSIMSKMAVSSKCSLYTHYIHSCTLQYYLRKPIPAMYQKMIAKFRLSSHCLAIETGRYTNIDVYNRRCFNCNSEVEDEFHFILKCPVYSRYRQQFIKPYFWKKPSVFKLVQLFTSENVKNMCNLGKYLHHSSILRSSLFK
jgi:hypothetical protein